MTRCLARMAPDSSAISRSTHEDGVYGFDCASISRYGLGQCWIARSVDVHLRPIGCPPAEAGGRDPFAHVPAGAETDRLAVDDVFGHRQRASQAIDRITAPAGMDSEAVRFAVRDLLVERSVDRQVGLDVMPIDPIEKPGLEPPGSQVFDEFVREDDVDVGGQHEPPARAPDPDVLRDHLKQRQHVGGTQRAVQLRRDRDEPVRAHAR